MRISDWSSDVCSSDLPALRLRHRGGAAAALRAAAPGAGVDGAAADARAGGAAVGVALRFAEGGRAGQRRQIGRASCRERVCPYVLISVVAGSLKKQREQSDSDKHDKCEHTQDK